MADAAPEINLIVEVESSSILAVGESVWDKNPTGRVAFAFPECVSGDRREAICAGEAECSPGLIVAGKCSPETRVVRLELLHQAVEVLVVEACPPVAGSGDPLSIGGGGLVGCVRLNRRGEGVGARGQAGGAECRDKCEENQHEQGSETSVPRWLAECETPEVGNREHVSEVAHGHFAVAGFPTWIFTLSRPRMANMVLRTVGTRNRVNRVETTRPPTTTAPRPR